MTNIELPLLCVIIDNSKVDLKVFVNFDSITDDTINISGEGKCYVIKLGSLAFYYIDPINDKIMCTARDFESFFSTFLIYRFLYIVCVKMKYYIMLAH